MKHAMAMTKNVRAFMTAVDELLNRPPGTEGMGLLWGLPGEGKSTTVAYVANAMDGIYVRAVGAWTVTSMLGELCRELGGERKLRRSDMIEFICERLTNSDNNQLRPIFVDEADYLFRQFEMVDSLRDIYDITGCPVILIGMEDIARKLQAHSRIARRITQWVEFHGIDLEDTRTVALQTCEVEIADDLLLYLHEQAKANIGRIIIGLTKIERMAKSSKMNRVDRATWGDRHLFWDQPSFSRQPHTR